MVLRSSIVLQVVLTLFATHAWAKDEWLCTEASSQRSENEISACGVANGKDENEARLQAFDNAKSEFTRICNSSSDCKNREITVEPKRTSCEKETESYKCYRLIIFTIGALTGAPVTPTLKTKDRPDKFEPFIYEQSLQYPKIKRWMSKGDMLALFGAPFSNSPEENGQQVFNFKGKMCVTDNTLCTVTIKKNKVTSWKNFNPLYTEDLK